MPYHPPTLVALFLYQNFFLFLHFAMLESEPRALYMLDKCSMAELYPQPCITTFSGEDMEQLCLCPHYVY